MRALAYAGALIAGNARKSVGMWAELLRIALPVVLAVRVLDEWFGLSEHAGDLLAPVMEAVGLPGAAGLAWAVGMLGQSVAGFLLLASQWPELQLTGAQATTFALLMLQAHSLPVEVRIAQQMGASAAVALTTRLASALLLAYTFSELCSAFGWLQEPAELVFIAAAEPAAGWTAWLLAQAQTWLALLPVIFALSVFMQLLRDLRAEDAFCRLLAPVMRIAGISRQAGTIVAIGTIMGLTIGGALLIRHTREGDVGRRDAFMCAVLLGLSHSWVDDALLAALFGSHLAGTLGFRLALALLLMALIAQLIARLPAAGVERWLMSRASSGRP